VLKKKLVLSPSKSQNLNNPANAQGLTFPVQQNSFYKNIIGSFERYLKQSMNHKKGKDLNI